MYLHGVRTYSSAIALCIAQGEASKERNASPLAVSAAEQVTSTTNGSLHSGYESAANGQPELTSVIHTTQDITTSSSYSNNSHAPVIDDRAAEASTTTSSVVQTVSTTVTLNGVSRHSNAHQEEAEEVFYAPMSDSEPEETGVEVQHTTLTVVRPEATAAAVNMNMDQDMLRSPSVSYVDPEEDLAVEQDRVNMMQLDDQLPALRPESRQSQTAEGRQASTSNPTLQLSNGPRSDVPRQHTPEYLEGPFSQPRGSRPPFSSPMQDDGLPLDPGTPASPGWGILGQQTPSQAATYDEEDELDELGESSPQAPRNDTPMASGSGINSRTGTLDDSAKATKKPATPDKGKQRATNQDEDLQATPSRFARQSDRGDEVLTAYDNADQLIESTRRDKGKQRAERELTPLPTGSQNRRNGNAATPSTVAHTSPKVARPAAPRRKYRGLERFKAAACLALDRSEAYLDVALEDENKTCWIRCVNWDVDADGPRQDSDDSDTVNVRSRAAGSSQSRQDRQKDLQAAVWHYGTSTQRPPRSPSNRQERSPERKFEKIKCSAEVLGELVDGDIQGDKWRVIKVSNEHSTACDMLIRQVTANEILQAAQIGLQAESDPELAEDVLAARFQQEEDEMDPELTLAIQESLKEARRLEENEEVSRYLNNVPSDHQQRDVSNDGASAELRAVPSAGPSTLAARASATESRRSPKVAQRADEAQHSVGEMPDDFPDIPTFEDQAPRQRSAMQAEQQDRDSPAEDLQQAGPSASSSGQGLFRRLYASFVPGTASSSVPTTATTSSIPNVTPASDTAPPSTSVRPSTHTHAPAVVSTLKCRTGDTFRTREDLYHAAAGVLSLRREDILCSSGDRYGVPYVNIKCPHSTTTRSSGQPTCQAQVNGYFREGAGPW